MEVKLQHGRRDRNGSGGGLPNAHRRVQQQKFTRLTLKLYTRRERGKFRR
jgi:hypothetical protein